MPVSPHAVQMGHTEPTKTVEAVALDSLVQPATTQIASEMRSIIEQGREVGLLARQMFPGGVTVESRDREQAGLTR